MVFQTGMLRLAARAASGAAVGATAFYGSLAHAEPDAPARQLPRPLGASKPVAPPPAVPSAGPGVAACLDVIEKRLSTIERALGLAAGGRAQPPAYDGTLPRAGPQAPIIDKKRKGEYAYTPQQVSRNDGAGGKPMWVSYRDGVYDVTAFAAEHPGGKFLLMAAGGPIDGFWSAWSYHHVSPKVVALLESMRIGELKGWKPADSDLDLYDNEPLRGDGQIVLIPEPYNSETNKTVMLRHLLTPNKDFYVRNHAPAPDLPEDIGEHDVSFCHEGEEVRSLTLLDLTQQFSQVTVTSIMQCAGNRGADCIKVHEGSGFAGTPYEIIDVGMLGNAEWGGVRLHDVLPTMFPQMQEPGFNPDEWHVEFEGVDGYSCSTPLPVVMDRANDCLLVTTMNGETLPRDHGFPCRALLPGLAGARNVKWVQRVALQKRECDSPWQTLYYKAGPKSQKFSIQALPLNSIILEPHEGGEVAVNRGFDVAGVAYSGATGNTITKVEVSVDRGASWINAGLDTGETPKNDSSRSHGWVRWSAPVGADRQADVYDNNEVWVRAFDDGGVSQTELGELNGGYLFNGYHKVAVAPVVAK